MSLEKLSVRRFIPPLLGKAMLIGLLIILLLIPLARMENLVGERVGMRQEAAQRVAESWGGTQTTAGVLLSIPVETSRVVIEQTSLGRETQHDCTFFDAELKKSLHHERAVPRIRP